MVPQRQRGEWSGLALLAGGIILVIMSLGGYAFGQYLDRMYHTGARWSTVGLILGLLIGFWDLYRISRWVIAQQPPITPRPVTDDEETLPEKDERGNDDES